MLCGPIGHGAAGALDWLAAARALRRPARAAYRLAIRVFHVDDDRAFCELVRHWLADHDELEHAGYATAVGEALERLPGLRADVVLVDSMGGADPGRDLVAELRAAAGGARIVLYTGFPEPVARAQVTGAVDGYVLKGSDESALVAGLRALG
jgi:two-component system response regulator (stage 0 sporulation protein A)